MTESVRTLLTRGTDALRAAGIDSAAAEAAWLLAAVLEVDRGRLLLADDPDPAAVGRFDALVERRSRREPLQHILGTAPFGRLELAVGPGVFIPRPETELLVDRVARQLADAPGPLRIADFCAGSGAIALGLADLLPTASVTAVERSPAALEWLHRNVADHRPGPGERVTVVAGDVTDVAAMSAATGTGLDAVVSNPPYVPASEVSAEVAADPAEAVFGGTDGMAVIVPMVTVIAGLLLPGGLVAIEHDDTTADAVIDTLTEAGFVEVTGHLDLAGRPRFVTALAPDVVDDIEGRHGRLTP